MRAIVVDRPGEVSLREVEQPRVGPGDVLVQSRAAGLCRTDMEIIEGVFTDERWVRFPCIPGHEWCGVVAETGDAVRGVRPGQRVVCEGNLFCGVCPPCRRGETNLCTAH